MSTSLSFVDSLNFSEEKKSPTSLTFVDRLNFSENKQTKQKTKEKKKKKINKRLRIAYLRGQTEFFRKKGSTSFAFVDRLNFSEKGSTSFTFVDRLIFLERKKKEKKKRRRRKRRIELTASILKQYPNTDLFHVYVRSHSNLCVSLDPECFWMADFAKTIDSIKGDLFPPPLFLWTLSTMFTFTFTASAGPPAMPMHELNSLFKRGNAIHPFVCRWIQTNLYMVGCWAQMCLKIKFYWCNLMIHVVSMIIVRSV